MLQTFGLLLLICGVVGFLIVFYLYTRAEPYDPERMEKHLDIMDAVFTTALLSFIAGCTLLIGSANLK